MRIHKHNLVGKPESILTLVRLTSRWENTTQLDLKQKGCDYVGWIHQAQGSVRFRADINTSLLKNMSFLTQRLDDDWFRKSALTCWKVTSGQGDGGTQQRPGCWLLRPQQTELSGPLPAEPGMRPQGHPPGSLDPPLQPVKQVFL